MIKEILSTTTAEFAPLGAITQRSITNTLRVGVGIESRRALWSFPHYLDTLVTS